MQELCLEFQPPFFWGWLGGGQCARTKKTTTLVYRADVETAFGFPTFTFLGVAGRGGSVPGPKNDNFVYWADVETVSRFKQFSLQPGAILLQPGVKKHMNSYGFRSGSQTV